MPPEAPANRLVLWFLWLVNIFALIIYAFIGYRIRALSNGLLLEIPNQLFTAIFVILGIGNTAFSFFGPFVSKVNKFEQFCLLRFAFAEAIGVYGFFLFICGASWTTFGIFLGWSLMLQLLVAPTESNRQGFLRESVPGSKGTEKIDICKGARFKRNIV